MPGFDPSPTVELWDLISRQDWAVCERAQLGVSSRAYKCGVYPRKDRLLFDFNERWRRGDGRRGPAHSVERRLARRRPPVG